MYPHFSFQDRHVKKTGDIEPVVDPSQDYTLLLGYENATHTVMRFKRKLDTCDTSYDIPISVRNFCNFLLSYQYIIYYKYKREKMEMIWKLYGSMLYRKRYTFIRYNISNMELYKSIRFSTEEHKKVSEFDKIKHIE